MTRRLALVALWLAATAFAVLLASFAVRLAGDKVVAQGPATVTRNQVEADLTSVPGTVAPDDTAPPLPVDPDLSVAPERRRPRPRRSPPPAPPPTHGVLSGPNGDGGAGAGPTAAGDPATTVPGGGGGGSGGGGGGGGGDDPGPVPPSTTGPTTTTPTVAVEQSFPLVGGSVRMRCVDTTASLVSSSPNPGYAMDVRSTGPREVEVRFTGSGHTSELKGSCVGGAIAAEAKESGGDGSGDTSGAG